MVQIKAMNAMWHEQLDEQQEEWQNPNKNDWSQVYFGGWWSSSIYWPVELGQLAARFDLHQDEKDLSIFNRFLANANRLLALQQEVF